MCVSVDLQAVQRLLGAFESGLKEGHLTEELCERYVRMFTDNYCKSKILYTSARDIQ